ncbi:MULTISPECIES: glycosyltransferase family 39 protein [unclassified Ensifer]|uniref:ArnT family glycosyltransferase n=1 Tax=unclassified Ensifer TaxID=2633371 RepID=UPI000813B2A6|nr:MULTISPECIES: glycosyltransferase family 39 protein [unclassified Ensifer]OCP00823.1 glycosyltransferase [Ensifer sp. LC14]OCP01895.1 glycosyltransferase [Ensifer sp. LC11]OCP01910.1 glycosyltransferase [Ensifer sp. LC13]OCP30310.1 glycosyltransferase [Ensifer sp. LC499]
MLEVVNRRPNLVIALIAGYFLLCISLRLSASTSLEIDESEQAFVSQFLMLGYGSQPPFYNWLQYGLTSLLGPSLATMTLLKNTLLFLCCLFIGLAGREVLNDRRLAAITALGVLTFPPVFLLAQRDLSHTVAALLAVSLFLYAFLRTMTRPSLFAYGLTGMAVGLGVISKYNFVLVPGAAILAILPEPKLRSRLFDWRILLAIAVCALIALPHGYWILQNIGAASNNTFKEMGTGQDASFASKALKAVIALVASTLRGTAIILVIFGVVFRKDLPAIWRAESRWARVVGRMLVICIATVLVIMLAVGATHMREKWLVLFLVLLPLYLALKVEASGVDTTLSVRPFLLTVGFIIVTTLVVVSTRAAVRPWFGKLSRLSIPYSTLIDTVVQQEGREPAMVLTTDKQMAGNLRTRLHGAKVLVPGNVNSPIDRLAGPLLVVWSDDGKLGSLPPEQLVNALNSFGLSETGKPQRLALPYLHGKQQDRYSFGYFWIDDPSRWIDDPSRSAPTSSLSSPG